MSKLTGQRILVIEDDAILSLDIEDVLCEAGAEIIGPASTVGRGLELAETLDLTAAIVDLRLQTESAAPVIELLKKRGIPFVFYSGQVDRTTASRWPNTPVLMKPARSEAIIDALAAVGRM